MTEQNNITHNKLIMIIPIGGWIYILWGIIFPFQIKILQILWYIDIFLSCIVHPLQLITAIPAGKKAGIGTIKNAVLTVIFGATWWRPVKEYTDRIQM